VTRCIRLLLSRIAARRLADCYLAGDDCAAATADLVAACLATREVMR